MLDSIKTKIIDCFVQACLDNTKDIEVYEYGLKLVFIKIIHIITILFMGWIGNELMNIIAFLLIYICIREYSGGYHSKTSSGCYLCTIAVTLAAIVFFKLELFHTWGVWSILLICGGFVWFYSPQETGNNPLEPWEVKCYRKRTRIFLLLFLIVSIILNIFYPLLKKGFACALLIQSIMLLVGKIDRQKAG